MPEEKNKQNNEKERNKDYEVPDLPKFEFLISVIIWLSFLFKGCYDFYKLLYTKKTLQYFRKQNLVKPFYFGLYKSVYDNQWDELLSLASKIWFPLIFYMIFSKLLRQKASPNVFMIGSTILTIVINYYYSSLKFLGMELIIFLIPAIFGLFKSKTLVWISGLSMLYGLRYVYKYPFFNMEFIFFHAFPYTALLITRSISTGLTIAESTKSDFRSFLEMLYFYFYFPAVIGCRMMTVKDFVVQIYKPFVIPNMKTWCYDAFRVVVYAILWSFIHKFVHVHLILSTHELRYIHFVSLMGTQLFSGLHFYMVYLVLYKSVFLLAQLDGFLTTDGPECIAHITLYSRMWKNFDTGLHVWLKEYVFRPIVKFGSFNVTKHLAICASFGFVCVFHGVQIHNIVWIVINVFQYYCENGSKFLYLHTSFGAFMERKFSPVSIRRIIGFFGGLSFIMSIYAFASFLFGLEFANLIYFSNEKFTSTLLCTRFFYLILFSYAQSQMSLTVNEYLRKRKLKTS